MPKKTSTALHPFWCLVLCTTLATAPAHSQSGEPEYGKAGYYADKLHGRKTAGGEPYDKTKLTCAHKTHPFGTMLRVTRVDNNLSVVVKVNDKGPFHEGYVVDLSRAAAQKIGLVKDGVARVKVEPLNQTTADQEATVAGNPPPPTTAAEATPPPGAAPAPSKVNRMLTADLPASQQATPAAVNTGPPANTNARASSAAGKSKLFQVKVTSEQKQGYAVQVALLASPEQLLNELSKMVKNWPDNMLVAQLFDEKGKTSGFKMLRGPYPDKAAATKAQKEVAAKGYKKCFVVSLSDL